MRVPNLQDRPSFVQGIGLVIGGIIIGCAIMTAVAQETIQQLQYDIHELKTENKSLSDQVESFEKVKNRRNVIDRTAVRWDTGQRDLGKATHGELGEKIAADLLTLVGKPVQTEMFDLYRSLVDGKVYYNVIEKNYLVRVTMLSIIGTELVVFVRAEEFVQN